MNQDWGKCLETYMKKEKGQMGSGNTSLPPPPRNSPTAKYASNASGRMFCCQDLPGGASFLPKLETFYSGAILEVYRSIIIIYPSIDTPPIKH